MNPVPLVTSVVVLILEKLSKDISRSEANKQLTCPQHCAGTRQKYSDIGLAREKDWGNSSRASPPESMVKRRSDVRRTQRRGSSATPSRPSRVRGCHARIDHRPRRQNESTFEYMNSSARPGITAIRELLERIETEVNAAARVADANWAHGKKHLFQIRKNRAR
jgi:hypothetical protein